MKYNNNGVFWPPKQEIRSVDELAECLHCDPRLLYSISNHTPEWYQTFTIPKRNGSKRIIEAPKPLLKRLQHRIQSFILAEFTVSSFATAFVVRRNIRHNAQIHVNQKMVFNCDVKNFFPSLKAGAVFSFFRDVGYEPAVAMMLTRLCTRYGHLPQGAPTSPKLSNLLLRPLDEELYAWGRTLQLKYSRYADDITFSGNIDKEIRQRILEKVMESLAEHGLELNHKKTAWYYHGNRQLVTGLVVNRQLGVPRENIRQLRTRLHYLELDLQKKNRINLWEVEHLLGLANYYCHINSSNQHLPEWRNELIKLKNILISSPSEVIVSGKEQ